MGDRLGTRLWRWALCGFVLIGLCSVAPAAANASISERVAGADPYYLPDPGCAPVGAAGDDAAHAFHPADASVVKVVYAYPSDASDDFTGSYPQLSQGVRDMMEYVYLESGNRKSLRFDLGTPSGSDCLDVQRIALPNPTSHYIASSLSASRERVMADVRPRLGAQPGARLFYVFADGVPNSFASANTEPLKPDDSKAGASWAAGNRAAVLFDNAAATSTPYEQVMGIIGVHEIFHLLGAVQPSAPHYAGGAHCSEMFDLMCDSPPGTPVTCPTRDYPTVTWLSERALDCGGDDYFNPEPPAGSYLATHWNTYDSTFLCPVGSCAPDNFGPEVSISGPKRTRDRTPTFRLASEPGAVFACQVDDRAPKICAAKFSPKLKVGRHDVAVTAFDAAGNASSLPASLTVRVRNRKKR